MLNIEQIQNNLTRVDLFGITLWTSYKTTVAFQIHGKRFVQTNQWSTTTGRHLTAIDGGSKEAKKARISEDEWLDRWNELVEPLFNSMQIQTTSLNGLGDLNVIRRDARKRAITQRKPEPKTNT